MNLGKNNFSEKYRKKPVKHYKKHKHNCDNYINLNFQVTKLFIILTLFWAVYGTLFLFFFRILEYHLLMF